QTGLTPSYSWYLRFFLCRVVLEIDARRGSIVNEVLLNAEAHFLNFVLPCPVTLQKTALIVVMTP
ncbi:hypothetical protein, partial [Escherichia albertii]|uniref:hypothetical protein n=1 Tax=Escherichia albertii TaxID=208962 RepID=UPI001F3F2310